MVLLTGVAGGTELAHSPCCSWRVRTCTDEVIDDSLETISRRGAGGRTTNRPHGEPGLEAL